MITAEQMKEMELQVPKYEFVEPEADAPAVSPIKRQIAKIQETASTFTLYDVYRTIGQLDKLIADKQVEIKGHEDMKELFEAELALIENQLKVTDLENQYKNEVLAEVAIQALNEKNS
jgi:hypothetical protein